MRVFVPRHLCWRPDVPDFRDFLPNSPEIRQFLPDEKQSLDALPNATDLCEFMLSCSDDLYSTTCPTSIVCTKLVEYFNYRCYGRIEPLNSQFVMRAVTSLVRGDCSGIRANLKAIRRFGIPTFSLAESKIAVPDCRLDHTPLGSADVHRSMLYFRLGSQLDSGFALHSLKAWLASGFPIAFGFSVPSSLDYDGFIEYRPTYDSIQGGHAALLVGFDDRQIAASRGAFRVYCPWGNEWGEQGFGWLPYTFIEGRIAMDFWTIISPEWVASGELFRSRESEN